MFLCSNPCCIIRQSTEVQISKESSWELITSHGNRPTLRVLSDTKAWYTHHLSQLGRDSLTQACLLHSAANLFPFELPQASCFKNKIKWKSVAKIEFDPSMLQYKITYPSWKYIKENIWTHQLTQKTNFEIHHLR